jgi:hypothetical protein
MRKFIMGRVGVIVLMLAGLSAGDTIELPLNCAGFYDVNTSPWTMDFDLGVTFSEISHVYIDWSGEINAGLYQDSVNPEPVPFNGRLDAYFGNYLPPGIAGAAVGGGMSTYPGSEQFAMRSEFVLFAPTWDFLLDGKEIVTIDYPLLLSWVHVIDYGSAVLNDATLVVEGTIIPEPNTLILLGLGFLSIRQWRTGFSVKKS